RLATRGGRPQPGRFPGNQPDFALAAPAAHGLDPDPERADLFRHRDEKSPPGPAGPAAAPGRLPAPGRRGDDTPPERRLLPRRATEVRVLSTRPLSAVEGGSYRHGHARPSPERGRDAWRGAAGFAGSSRPGPGGVPGGRVPGFARIRGHRSERPGRPPPNS